MPGLEGKTLGRYQLQKLVGRGGMADVYQGYDSHFEREVAVKVFKREDEEMLQRFIREAHLMATLRNEHLLHIYDSNSSQIGDTTWYYIVMPFMEGGTLRARIRRVPFALLEACQTLKEIALALDYVHQQGIVHRDIKSSNVLLDVQGHCYLSDFGIARTSTDVTQLTTTGNVLGTVDYVAPELFEVNRRADARSDLYSLGVLLFEMVTGQLPFSAENQIALVSMHMSKQPPSPRSITQNISPQVERVIFKALEKKPEQRYSSATELAAAFCHAVTVSNKTVVEHNTTFTQRAPEIVIPRSNQIVLPPVKPVTPDASAVRPVPFVHSTESVPYLPPHPISPASSSPPSIYPPRQTRRTSSPPSQRTRLGRSRGLIVALLALLMLLPLIFLGFYAATHPYFTSSLTATSPDETRKATTVTTPTQRPTATPNLTATTQAIVAVTATAHAQATSSAIAQATATAQAKASATAGVIQTATTGKPVYQDVLNDATNPITQAEKWDGADGSNSHCVFQSNGYHVLQDLGLINFRGCRETANTYKNATLSVDMNILSGHSGGLFFRLSTDTFGNYAGYLLEVDSQGNYKISTVTGSATTALPDHDWTLSSALKTGNNVKNTLQVIMRDNTFLFYVNGIFLTQMTDTTYSSDGQIGFLATTETTKADIVYSNVKIYPLIQ
ncbi:MAG: hypothetical protein NVS4B7_04840 [Ktedonobacteraceae bacterium]